MDRQSTRLQSGPSASQAVADAFVANTAPVATPLATPKAMGGMS